MAWQEILSEVDSPGLLPDGTQAYLRGQVIQQAVSEGASTTSIRSYLSLNGIGLRTSTIGEAIAQERTRQAARSTIAEIDWTSSLASELPMRAPANWTGQYVHQVTAVFRTRDDEGNYLLHTRTFGIKSSSVLSPVDATSAALDIASTPVEEGGSDTGMDVSSLLMISLSGLWYDTQGHSLRTVG